MPRDLKSLPQMNSDSLQYLAQNTDITFLSEGSIARSLVEATNFEVAKVQEYIVASYSNTFLNSASGYYLDLIGQMLGVRRLPASSGSSSIEDKNVKFYVLAGSLGNYFPNQSSSTQGKIPAGITVSTSDGSVVYKVAEDTVFPKNAKEVFVSVISDSVGPAFKVGRNKLNVHSGPNGVQVTNLKPIDNSSSIESDAQYRFRLANAIAARPTANETAIKMAALGSPDISTVILNEFSRGAGTFDALLVPVGNTVSNRSSELVKRGIESVAAFGISVKVREPEYVKFRITVQLVSSSSAQIGALDVNKIRAKTAILSHFETIRLGGELVINRLKSDIITSLTGDIKDINIVEICFNGRPHLVRNFKLNADELFTPDNDPELEAIEIL